MYAFILNMWSMSKIDEAKVKSYVVKGHISLEEANTILNTTQIAT